MRITNFYLGNISVPMEQPITQHIVAYIASMLVNLLEVQERGNRRYTLLANGNIM